MDRLPSPAEIDLNIALRGESDVYGYDLAPGDWHYNLTFGLRQIADVWPVSDPEYRTITYTDGVTEKVRAGGRYTIVNGPAGTP